MYFKMVPDEKVRATLSQPLSKIHQSGNESVLRCPLAF